MSGDIHALLPTLIVAHRMTFPVALLANRSLPFSLYASFIDGTPVSDLAQKTGLPEEWVAERIEAVRLTITMQVRLRINPQSSCFLATESRHD